MAVRGGARAHTNIDRTVVATYRDGLRGSDDAGLFGDLATPLFLVDGNNLLWRAAHGYRAPFEAVDGRDITPLFRFVTLLRRSLGTFGLFAECVVCFDGPDAWAERLDLDATYKGNRTYEDRDLSFMGWLPEIRAALDCTGVTNVEIADSEADDVIGTLTARADGRPVRILSTDRDYYQLIGPTTLVVNPRGRPALIDEAFVLGRYGVAPGQWCDLRALAGDPSDGIPGLPGVGMTRAAALLRDAKGLETLRDELGDHLTDVVRWRELIRIRTNIDVGDICTGRPTPKLPSASAVCAALGLV
jgi:DNA polymerase I